MPIAAEKNEKFSTAVLPGMLALGTLATGGELDAEPDSATSAFRLGPSEPQLPTLKYRSYDSSVYLDAHLHSNVLTSEKVETGQERKRCRLIWDDAFGGHSFLQSARELTIVPGAFRAQWFRLGRSQLPNSAFTHLLAAAIMQRLSKPTGSSGLSSGSLITFLKLWEALGGECAEPAVSISPKGDIIAEWFSDADNSLVVMAHRNRVLHFSLFADSAPVEGWERYEKIPEVVAMLKARKSDHFCWSDANEG
jgi:hypothetical protein